MLLRTLFHQERTIEGLLGTSFAQKKRTKSVSLKKIPRDFVCFTSNPQDQFAIKLKLNIPNSCQENCGRLEDSDWFDGEKLLLSENCSVVSHKKYGLLGVLPPSAVINLRMLKAKGHSVRAELADITGNSHDKIPLKLNINIKCQSDKSQQDSQEVVKTFKRLLNTLSDKNKAFKYHSKSTIEEINSLITPKDEAVVGNILNEIKNAKSILLIGHQVPDGDTIGSVLGFKSILELLNKEVDASIDADIPGAYRNSLPGIYEKLSKPSNLPVGKPYDLTIVLDTPVGRRVGGNLPLILDAKKVAFIDHHALNEEEWQGSYHEIISRAEQDRLMLIKPDMPATTELLTAIMLRLIPKEKLETLDQSTREEIAKPFLAGIYTDTVRLTFRLDDHEPESVAKFLMNWAGIGKKFLNDQLNYHIPEKAKQMVDKIKANIDETTHYASLKVSNKELNEIYTVAKEEDEHILMQDVKDEFTFYRLPALQYNPKSSAKDRLAVLFMQDDDTLEKKFASIRLRSPEGSGWAKTIADLLKGGGHQDMAFIPLIGSTLEERGFTSDNNSKKLLTIEEKIVETYKTLLEKSKSKLSDSISFTGSQNAA